MLSRPRLSASTHIPIRITEINSERPSNGSDTLASCQEAAPAYSALRNERAANAIRYSNLRDGMPGTLTSVCGQLLGGRMPFEAGDDERHLRHRPLHAEHL